MSLASMKLAIVALCLLAVAEALSLEGLFPVNNSKVRVISYDNENSGLGGYSFSYHLTDGTWREERGELKNPGTAEEALTVTGTYTWVDLQGVRWIVKFIADENGFRPHVSQGIGIPAPIVASLLG